MIHPSQKLLMTDIHFDLVSRGNDEWQRTIRSPIVFGYQFGALDCRMRDGTMTIEGAELDAALREDGIDIVNE